MIWIMCIYMLHHRMLCVYMWKYIMVFYNMYLSFKSKSAWHKCIYIYLWDGMMM